jgi:hypothetical protein
LLSQKVITVSRDSSDHRRLNYGLTRKGKGLQNRRLHGLHRTGAR